MKIDINIGNEHILKHFPNFEYFNCTEPERLVFNRTDNLVGDQQRAFVLYHILQEVKKNGEIGASCGCGQIIENFTIGIDKFCTDNHPIYGGRYWPHLTADCNVLPFNDNVFAFVVGVHILEHMENPLGTFKEWVRILKPGGALIIIMPDAKYEKILWDIDHKVSYSPEKFEEKIILPCKDLISTEVFNNLNNLFSFNYVGRKK